MTTFYIIGVLIAFILGCILIYKEKNEENLQYGMIAPLALLSWISVILILWKFRKFLFWHNKILTIILKND